jgi:hypothetical protein
MSTTCGWDRGAGPTLCRGLVWLSFPLPPSGPEDLVHIQVRQERAAAILTLEIDGALYLVVRDAGDTA